MTDPSPAPAGLASDREWRPRRWETTFIYRTHEDLQSVIDEVSDLTKALGGEGWEIVGSSMERVQVAHHFRDYDKLGDLIFEWTVVCTLKRPLAPE